MFKRFTAAFVALLLGMLSVLIGGGAAHAEPASVVCGGTTTTEFSPGLLLTPQEVFYEETNNFSPCVSTTHPSITAGTLRFEPRNPITLSCLNPQDAGSATRTITWNTGQTSEFTYNVSVSNVGGQSVLTRTGFIESGLFAGANAIQTITSPSLDLLLCLFPPGIEDRLGVTTLNITSLS